MGLVNIREYPYPDEFITLKDAWEWARQIYMHLNEAEYGAAEELEDAFSDFCIFKTINCPSGTDPVADQRADTLNLTASGPMIVTGTVGTDTVDFDWAHLGIESLTDPGADRIAFWDDSETATKWLACDGTTIGITATTLAVIQSGIDHGTLAGLGDDDHPQYIKDTEFTQNSGVLVGTGAGTFAEETGATLRTSLGLVIGTDVQAWDADLDTYAGITPSANMQTFLANASFAAMMADLSGTATAAFAWNSQNLTGIGTVGCGNITGGTYNALTLTSVATGFTVAGGTTPKTLTLNDDFNASTQLTAIGANTTHRGSVGTDHGYIDQDLQQAASPTFADLTLSVPVNIYGLSHDAFANFVENEHINWTNAAVNLLTSGTVGSTGVRFPALGTNYDVCFSAVPTGNDYIRIIATNTLTAQPTGAAIQFFANSMAGYNGQIYFDTGSHASAAIIFRTAPASTNLIERMRIGSDGHIDLYDWDDAVLREVSFGADDSGGAGYKVLRVPN